MVGVVGNRPLACEQPVCGRPWCVRHLAGLILLLVVAASGGGCGGCWRSPEDAADAQSEQVKEAKKKAKPKPKEDFERLQATTLPDNAPSSARERPPLLVKPGHWVALSETWKANHADLAGELSSFVEEMGSARPQPLEFFPARIWPRFPAVLPKGQAKRIETLLYVPPPWTEDAVTWASPLRQDPAQRLQMPSFAQSTASRASIRTELSRRGDRAPLAASSTLVQLMHEHEYLVVVLVGDSVDPSAYAHLDQLPSVYLPQVEGPGGATLRHYYVVRPRISRSVPLPVHSLAWTTISHVIWDGLDPALFSTPQQEALLDWLHWGGQLVISGPQSLEKLRGSFLAPYLPGEAVGTASLDYAAFEELNSHFSMPSPTRPGASRKGEAVQRIRILPAQPMVGIELRPHPQAQAVEGTGGLVWERRVGGGRTAVVRFPLTDPRIKIWKNLDNFVNSVLLRRPGREFRLLPDGTVHVAWHPSYFWRLLQEDTWGARSHVTSPEKMATALAFDPRLNSTVRFLSRDLVAPSWNDMPWPADLQDGPPWLRGTVPPSVFSTPRWGAEGANLTSDVLLAAERLADWHFAGYGSRPASSLHRRPGGVASWNEGSSLGHAADAVLVQAAGIKIPTADFVWKVMAVYLVVLVPVNALVFWLLGRLEWAWAAVPVLAAAAALVVVRLAQLDIGFSRSRTEVAVLEVQGGYPRGHLTRFTALYSSLSTHYTLSFEPANAVALPHAVRSRRIRSELLPQITDLTLERDRAVTLRDVPVASNSTAILRSEQFLPLKAEGSRSGTLDLYQDAAGAWIVSNGTLLDLHEAALFRLPAPAEHAMALWRGEEAVEVAYLARLEPGGQKELTWVPLRAQAREPAEVEVRETLAPAFERPALWPEPWNASRVLGLPAAEDGSSRRGSTARGRLTELAVVVLRDLKLLPGEARLIAWTDQNLPGLTIRPQASQNQALTLVVAHLARGRLPPPLPDKNRLEDVAPAAEEPLNLEEPPSVTPPVPPLPNSGLR